MTEITKSVAFATLVVRNLVIFKISVIRLELIFKLWQPTIKERRSALPYTSV